MKWELAVAIADLVTREWSDKFPDASERAWFHRGVALWVQAEADGFRRASWPGLQ